MTRRHLFSTFAVSVAASAKPKYAPRLGSQFYIWTQQFNREKKPLAEGIPEAFAATRRAGFKRIELVSWIFTRELREKTIAAAKEHGLDVPIVYSGARLYDPAAADKAIAQVLELAEVVKPLGTRMIDVNPDPKGQRKTNDELRVQADNITRLDKGLADRGFRLILHHHNPEMAENAREWRHILANTKTALCVDTHWVYRGGQDPLALLKEAGPRVAALHLRNSRSGIWTEDLGDGDVDYRAIAAYLRKAGFAGDLVVELAYEQGTKITRTLEEDLRVSREYTEKVFEVKSRR